MPRMLKVANMILKTNVYLYISTVIKKWYGFWNYWKKGFKLYPTHLREYPSKEEFLNFLKRNGFEIVDWTIENFSYLLLNLIVRISIKAGKIGSNSLFYLTHMMLNKLRSIKIRVAGYYTNEVVGVMIK